MTEQIKIKALWIDDEPSESFMDLAFSEGIDIESYQTVSAGLDAIDDKTKLFDCLIIDANNKNEKVTEAPSLHALRIAVEGIIERKLDIPWFVYTGGSYDGREALEYMLPDEKLKRYGEKLWYEKPDDQYELFSAIKRAVENREETRIKRKYPEAFALYGTDEMMDLLKRIDSDEFNYDPKVPNTLRCVGEAVCDYLHDNHVYPIDFTSSNKIKECSKLLGADKKNKFIPSYIQGIFFFLSIYCNGGSHGGKIGNEDIRACNLRDAILLGTTGYLNKIAMLAMLTVIKWSRSFPFNDEQEMKRITMFMYGLSQK